MTPAHPSVGAFLEALQNPRELARLAAVLRPCVAPGVGCRRLVGCTSGSQDAPGATKDSAGFSPDGASRKSIGASLGSQNSLPSGGSSPHDSLESTFARKA
jgi:hypothetical protein